MSEVVIPVAVGELVDKIAILTIKSECIYDKARLANVRHELARLQEVAAPLGLDGGSLLETELFEINQSIWEAEDGLRACEADGDFGPKFVALARRVVRDNDQRAAVKKRINLATGSAIVEEKSY